MYMVYIIFVVCNHDVTLAIVGPTTFVIRSIPLLPPEKCFMMIDDRRERGDVTNIT